MLPGNCEPHRPGSDVCVLYHVAGRGMYLFCKKNRFWTSWMILKTVYFIHRREMAWCQVFLSLRWFFEHASSETWHHAISFRWMKKRFLQVNSWWWETIFHTNKIDTPTNSMTQKDRRHYVACAAHDFQATRDNMRQLAATCPLTRQTRTTVISSRKNVFREATRQF